MKEEILSEVRPFVFQHILSKVSGMLDQYRSSVEQLVSKTQREDEDPDLLRDQIEHLIKALAMIAEVPESSEGATMARSIAQEAISALH